VGRRGEGHGVAALGRIARRGETGGVGGRITTASRDPLRTERGTRARHRLAGTRFRSGIAPAGPDLTTRRPPRSNGGMGDRFESPRPARVPRRWSGRGPVDRLKGRFLRGGSAFTARPLGGRSRSGSSPRPAPLLSLDPLPKGVRSRRVSKGCRQNRCRRRGQLRTTRSRRTDGSAIFLLTTSSTRSRGDGGSRRGLPDSIRSWAATRRKKLVIGLHRR